MRGLAAFAIVVSIASWGCSDKTPTNPAALRPTFTATLSPANEVPAVSNAAPVGTLEVLERRQMLAGTPYPGPNPATLGGVLEVLVHTGDVSRSPATVADAGSRSARSG